MKKNSYKFDAVKQTLTLSAAFAEAMNDPTSEEYQLMRQFQSDFPSLVIVRRTHKSPAKPNKHSGLTYERMERFMSALPDGVDYLEAYFTLREKAEAMCSCPYAVVSAWFMRQFPKFRTNPLFYLDSAPAIIDFSAVLEKSAKKPSVVKMESEQESA